MAVPRPGTAVRGSSTGRPIMALLDLLGRRWVLRILWELSRESGLGFRALQERCDRMSPSVLSQRLAELVEAGLVAQREDSSYELSPLGGELVDALAPLNSLAGRWAEVLPDPEEQ